MDSETGSLASTTQLQKPLTPLESLKFQYQQRTSNITASTASNSVTSGKSLGSTMSTSSARFFEMEARFTRHQSDLNRKEKISSDRLEQIERQLQRFDELDSKLASVSTTINAALESTRQSQATDRQNMNDKLIAVMRKQSGSTTSIDAINDKLTLLMSMLTLPNTRPVLELPQDRAASSTTPSNFSTDNLTAVDDGTHTPTERTADAMSLRSRESHSSSSAESSKISSPEKNNRTR